ncbi:MAG: DUF2157 domain-containing protein [Fluviicola sp.]
MNLKEFLDDCKKEQIIDESTVDKMYSHFLKRQKQNTPSQQTFTQQPSNNNALIITVGIIGVILIGFGIIYLFAHNWDQLSRSTKTLLSFIPVVISIAANVFTLTKRKDSVVWQESTAVSTFLAVGSMLALILQIYQLPGIENYFFFYWCLLCIPIVYILNSHVSVLCAMALMSLNLLSNPIDQSSLIRIPWFGSLLLFMVLLPYFKRLFTLREPDSFYITQQITVPAFVCLSVLASMSSSDVSVWIITFLLMVNFHLFGTSVFLRRTDRTPKIMSILSYSGMSLALSYLLFNKHWRFNTFFDVGEHNYHLYFIPILFLLALFQLFNYFKKEKLTSQNAYKLILFFPLPFILMDFYEIDVLGIYQLSVVLFSFLFIHFAQKNRSDLQLYPAASFIALIILSFVFLSTEKYALFYFSLIPSLYYFVIAYFLPKSKNTELQSEVILILCFQIVILIIASFESFWMAFNFTQKEFTTIQFVILSLVIIGILTFAYKAYENIKAQFNGLFGIISFVVPILIFIGCVSPLGIQHLFTVLLLLLGVVSLIFGAKKANLTLANLSLGLIGTIIICRFLDLKMSLTVKGILFIAIGLSFFLANYFIIKNKKHENS